jgi:hypothetical protein
MKRPSLAKELEYYDKLFVGEWADIISIISPKLFKNYSE